MPVLDHSPEPEVINRKTITVTRCFKGKVLTRPNACSEEILSGNDAKAVLKRTLSDFNDAVRFVIDQIEAARKPSADPRMKRILTWLIQTNKNANNAHDVLEPLTRQVSKITERRQKDFDEAVVRDMMDLKAQNKLLFDIDQEYPWLKTELRRKVLQKAVEKIKAHEKLVDTWQNGDRKDKKDLGNLFNQVNKVADWLVTTLKNHNDELGEARLTDTYLDEFIIGFTDAPAKTRERWLREFMEKSPNHLETIYRILNQFGTGEPGKSEWWARKQLWESQHTQFMNILWPRFFNFLTPDNRHEQQDKPWQALDHLITDLARESQLSTVMQQAFTAEGLLGVYKALGETNPENLQNEFFGIPFRKSYKRDHRALRAVRTCGQWLVRQYNPKADFVDLQPDQVPNIGGAAKSSRIHKRVEAAWDILLNQNPALKQLMADQQDYLENWINFRRKPAFTRPDMEKHPEWLDFKKKDSYKNLDFNNQTVSLLVAANKAQDKTRYDWRTFKFGIDARFKGLVPEKALKMGRKINKDTGEVDTKEVIRYRWHDPRTGEAAQIEVKGIKLVMKRDMPELVFTMEYPKTMPKKANDETKTRTLPGTRVLSIDFGQKYELAWAAYEQTLEGPKPVNIVPLYLANRKKNQGKSKALFCGVLKVPCVTFAAIANTQKQIASKTSKMAQFKQRQFKIMMGGRFISRGTLNNRRLRDYLRRQKEERVKKTATMLVQTAIKLRDNDPNRSIVIVHENLKSFKTTLKNEKWQNQRLQIWSVQKVIETLEKMAEAYGIIVCPGNPAFTSRLCNICHSPGLRFSVPDNRAWARFMQKEAEKKKITLPERDRSKPLKVYVKELEALLNLKRHPLEENGGDFFCCPNVECKGLVGKRDDKSYDHRNKLDKDGTPYYLYTVNADINAARNINFKFHQKLNYAEIWAQADETTRKEGYERIETFLKTYYGTPDRP